MKYTACCILLLLAMFWLAACGSTDVVFKPVPVDVPVSVPCHITPPLAPQFATQGITDKTPLPMQVSALAATNEQRKGYEGELNAAIASCQ